MGGVGGKLDWKETGEDPDLQSAIITILDYGVLREVAESYLKKETRGTLMKWRNSPPLKKQLTTISSL